MHIIHISTEFYPVAKAGGMADVVGALPLYQQKLNQMASVILPKYRLPGFRNRKFLITHSDQIEIGAQDFQYKIIEYTSDQGIPLIIIDIPDLFDRDGIYLAANGEGHLDESIRNIAFQRIAQEYLLKYHKRYDVIHCHDHQAGLIPFYIKYHTKYKVLKNKTVFFTIHNGQYQGQFDWSAKALLEEFPDEHAGVLDWDGRINSMATAVKCADVVNTVSPSYLEEIKNMLDSTIYLFEDHKDKCYGILNGIDHDAWHPKKDSFLAYRLSNSWQRFKSKNKDAILKNRKLTKAPVISFIGRFAYQKGADQLFKAIQKFLKTDRDIQFLILGSGDLSLEKQLKKLTQKYPQNVIPFIEYNEARAHQIYAASDFIIMPSRFEPCGLNQMFAMRYGTIPIVRNTGGLRDTVVDMVKKNGYGICFEKVNVVDLLTAFKRAQKLYENENEKNIIIKKITKLDFSWTKSAKEYLKLYRINQKIKNHE